MSRRFFSHPANQLFIARLALVELHSTFARLVRECAISPQDFADLVTLLKADVARGQISVVAVNSRRLEGAATLLSTHGVTHPMRTLDAIHLATAQALHARRPLTGFVAADKKLLTVADQACGLPVLAID